MHLLYYFGRATKKYHFGLVQEYLCKTKRQKIKRENAG
jgi:hypothetical protein